MHDHILQAYIDNITQHYGLSHSYIFSAGRGLEKTEPRNLFFYLCHKKGIPIVSVEKFLNKNHFHMHYSTILHNIQKITTKIEGDSDYSSIIKKLGKIRKYV